MTSKQAEIEEEIRKIDREITQIESELMSPDCNLEGIREREVELRAKNTVLRRELSALKQG